MSIFQMMLMAIPSVFEVYRLFGVNKMFWCTMVSFESCDMFSSTIVTFKTKHHYNQAQNIYFMNNYFLNPSFDYCMFWTVFFLFFFCVPFFKKFLLRELAVFNFC